MKEKQPIVKPNNPPIPKKKVKRKTITKKKWSAIAPLPPLGEKKKNWRPTLYSQKHIDYAEKYLASCIDTERKRIKSESESIGGSSTSWEYGVNVNLPTIEGLCVYYYDNNIWISRETIYKWKSEKGKESFSDILEKIMSVQASRLLKNGLNWDYNSTIAKMMLTKHWYVEKTENDTTLNGSLTLAGSLLELKKIPQKSEV